MDVPQPIIYHFEEDSSPAGLKTRGERLFKAGWRKVGPIRKIEMKFPTGQTSLHFSQAFARSAEPLPCADTVWRCLDARCTAGQGRYHGEIAPGEHLLQIYQSEFELMDSLERFAAAGLAANEAVVLICTPAHREEMARRLAERGMNIAALRADDRYIDLDAAETLARFMRDGVPDEALFRETIHGVLQRSRKNGRKTRAFGEMVALLWDDENHHATLALEQYWHVLCQLEDLPLFCAYPWDGFDTAEAEALREIYGAHSRLVG